MPPFVFSRQRSSPQNWAARFGDIRAWLVGAAALSTFSLIGSNRALVSIVYSAGRCRSICLRLAGRLAARKA
jgi:hypothetical protein